MRSRLLGGAALVAAVLLLGASAAFAADMIKVQGESMTLATGITVVNDSSAEPTGAGKAIRYNANATARKSVTYTKGASQIVVRARKDGTNAQHPLLKVYTKTGTQTPVLRGSATVSSTSYQEYTFPFSASSGTHQIQVRGANIASGRLLRVDYFRIPETAPIADTTPPETTITSGPGDTSDGTADFAFSSEIGSTFECKLVGYETTRNTCNSSMSYSGLVAGTSYTFKVWAKDAAGNIDPTPATLTFTPSDGTPAPAVCADGRDNDGDGKTDLADPGCSSPADTDEFDAPTGTTARLVGAGDIATSGSAATATGDLIDARPDARVFTAGDNAYPDGTASDYTTKYEPAWGLLTRATSEA
jgi:hypothetical protein